MTDKHQREFVAAYVPSELKRALIERAQAHDRSVSAELRQAVRAHLKQQEEQR